MKHNENKTLILGIGNYLMGDEGVGVHTALQLQELDLPDYVEVVDGGTGGFHLLEYFENHEHVILIDATLGGEQPGQIRLIKPRFAKDFPSQANPIPTGENADFWALVAISGLVIVILISQNKKKRFCWAGYW